MWKPSDHTVDENRTHHFANNTDVELIEISRKYIDTDRYRGEFYIGPLDELFNRWYSKNGETQKLVILLKGALERYKTEIRYKHYHCNEKIIAHFKDRIKAEPQPSEENVMSMVTCLDAFYSAGLKYESDKSGIEKLTSFIMRNWTEGLGLFEQFNEKHANPNNVNTFLRALKIGRDPYSFVTKFYHQFNSNYPIYDSKLKKFLILLFPKLPMNDFKDYIKYYYILNYVLLESLNKHNLEMGINDFDNAAWILMKEKEEQMKEKGEKLTLKSLIN